MPLAPAAALALSLQCAPHISPGTLMPLVAVESGRDPLAIGVNAPRPYSLHPPSLDGAVAITERLLAAGANLDLGLAQINSRNLARLGLTVRAAFQACPNLTAAQTLLSETYRRSAPDRIGPQAALRTALSYYNTGSATRGWTNGYVDKVLTAAGIGKPAPSAARRPRVKPAMRPASPGWDAFADLAPTTLVLNPDSSGAQP